jgi:hypothetical protein
MAVAYLKVHSRQSVRKPEEKNVGIVSKSAACRYPYYQNACIERDGVVTCSNRVVTNYMLRNPS